MLVPRAQRDEAVDRPPREPSRASPSATRSTERPPSGRWSSQAQFDKIQGLIQRGIEEGATLVAGGPGGRRDSNRATTCRPTVFGDVTPDMTIAREEIFGPVLSIIGYDTEDEAVEIANDTPLRARRATSSRDSARRAPSRAASAPGRSTSTARRDPQRCPFGGYKQSGNGREFGVFGFEEYLEVKAILGR